MGENEQSAQKRNVLVQVGIWAFCLGAAAGFGICWMFLAGDSDNKPIEVSSTRQPRTVSPARPMAPPPADVSGQMTEFRSLVGQSLLFKVTGAAGGATIWGTDIYTDDSPLPITAVHFGALNPGEEGIIRVTILPGRDRYDGSVRNGVTSAPYAKWEGSYALERVNGPTTEPVIDVPVNRASQTPPLLDDPTPATGPAQPGR